MAAVAGMLAGAAGIVSGCGATAAAPKAPEPTVVIGYENNGADPEMVAIADRLFSRYMHAHVELRYFSSGPASLAALGSGALDFMTGIGNPPVVSAIATGVPLQVIWAQERYTSDEGLVVRVGSHIRSLSDLAGKTVALVVGSTSPFELDTALKQQGIAPGSVKFLNMSPPAMAAAWSRGEINAAYVWDPVFDSMVHDHGRILMVDQNVAASAPIFNLAVVNAKWAAAHPGLAEGFIRAENSAVAAYRAHPATALATMAKEAGISVALARSEMAGYQIYDAKSQLGPSGLGSGSGVASSLVTTSLTSAGAYLVANHSLTSVPANMAQYVNPQYAQAVAGK